MMGQKATAPQLPEALKSCGGKIYYLLSKQTY